MPGDLTLPRLHDVTQAAMGWTDSHLHRFRTGSDHRSPYFVTTFDLDEGEDGAPEDDVRLDQLIAVEGDGLWYEYDFGDGWDHALRLEEILDEPPATMRCIGGRMACPPEDCGGIGGYEELAKWVRSEYDDTLLPDVFDDAAHAHDWLPLDWHPDHFDLDEVNGALSAADAEPVGVTGELAELLEQMERRGIRTLREERSGITGQHIVGRLPLGTKDFDRHAGWLALAVAGSGVPSEDLRDEVGDLLLTLGWRTDSDPYSRPPAHSPTLDVLDELAGAARIGWRVTGTDLGVAATARAVIRRD